MSVRGEGVRVRCEGVRVRDEWLCTHSSKMTDMITDPFKSLIQKGQGCVCVCICMYVCVCV